MNRSFKDRGTEDVFHGRPTTAARRSCPPGLWAVARRKLDQLDSVSDLRSLTIPPGNRLEALRGDRAGEHSIRVNARYRVVFTWTGAGPEQVEIVDYH
ncbi:MAG: type II toxin-antitoxin system RelE/ParE family toxin [Gemmatimonadota bacterium]|nr:type II toxin-antitoxin system RelE/ParE family toxin [Gemmatimonadota bacterium]